MLTKHFQHLLDTAEAHRPVTGIVSLNVPAHGVQAELAELNALIEEVRTYNGARVNPLEGTCQAILVVPVEGWRQLIDSREMLFAGPKLRVDANVQAFGTLPEP